MNRTKFSSPSSRTPYVICGQSLTIENVKHWNFYQLQLMNTTDEYCCKKFDTMCKGVEGLFSLI